MKFYCIELDNHVLVCNHVNEKFSIPINNFQDAKLLCELLNELDKRVEYYNRVLDKCIVNEKKYNILLEEKDLKIKELNQENSILRKIISEAEYL